MKHSTFLTAWLDTARRCLFIAGSMFVLVSMAQCAGTPTRKRGETRTPTDAKLLSLTAVDQQLLSQTQIIGLVVTSSSWRGTPFNISFLISNKLTDLSFVVVEPEGPEYSDCDVILYVKYREKKGFVLKSLTGGRSETSTALELQMTLKHKRFGELFRREIRIPAADFVELYGSLHSYEIAKLKQHPDLKFLGYTVLGSLGAPRSRIEIAGVLPLPEGYGRPMVLITNLTGRGVNLKGWYLQARSYIKHHLRTNYIKPGETIRLEVDTSFFFANKFSSCIELRDRYGAQRDYFCWDGAEKGEISR